MTVDERLEFLLRSSESLHATARLTTDQLADLARETADLTRKMADLTRKFDGMVGTMSDIALAVLNHERRLGKLDGGGE